MSSPDTSDPSHEMQQSIEEIQEAFAATGWKQAELARRSGVAVRTLRRVLAGGAKHDRRTIVQLRRALNLPMEGTPPAPPDPRDIVQELSTIELVAELSRRLHAADMLAERERIRLGELPPDIVDKPGMIRGPDNDTPRARSDDT